MAKPPTLARLSHCLFYDEDWSKYDDVKAFGAPIVYGSMRLAHAFARSMHAFAGVVLSCIGPAWPPRDCLSKKLLGSKPAVFVAGQLAMFVLEAILGRRRKKNRVVRRASRYREASVVDLPPCRTKGYDVLVAWTYTNESTALAYKISFWIDR